MAQKENNAQLLELLDFIKSQDSYTAKTQITNQLLNAVTNKKNKITSEMSESIKNFVLMEITKLNYEIQSCTTYKKKSQMFDYFESLMGIVVHYYPNPHIIEKETTDIISEMIGISQRSHYFENAVNSLFEQESIEENEAEHICDMASRITDEYQRGLIFKGLIYYRNQFDKLNKEAKEVFGKYIEAEIKKYLEKSMLTEDERDNLEFACDVFGLLPTENTATILNKAIEKGDLSITYHSVSSLLTIGKTVSKDIIEPLARSLTYANMTYFLLEKHSVTRLFPAELIDNVYLAKSDLVHWLTYPTELGKEPDEIEFIGCTKVKKEIFHIFKFRSDSDCLSSDLKNKWLIGWSSNDGGTFSEFQLFEDFDKGSNEKTAKFITKKILK